MRDRDPLDAIADVACPHVHHHAMCAPCAADAIRPELERALLVRNAANAMAGVQKRRADRLRKELEHAKAALARDNEGIRLWMLTCAEATERHRQNAARSEAAAEEAEAAIERVRALCNDPNDRRPYGSRVVHHRWVLAALDQPTEEARCGRCGGTRIEPGSEDYDHTVYRDNPYTGEPCSACQQGAALTPPRRLTEQQGGIPNDAITRADWEAAHAHPTDTTGETEAR